MTPPVGAVAGPQRGSATVLALVAVVVTAAVVGGLGRLGASAHAAARAAAVADLTALAAVSGGPGSADRVARSSGATVLELELHAHDTSRVVVSHGGVVAQAAARPVALDTDRRREARGG